MGKGCTAIIAVATFAVAACEPATAPQASPESARVLLPSQDIFENRLSLDDIVERILPSIDDPQAAAGLQIELAAFRSSLAGGNTVRARASLRAAHRIVDDLAERTGSGGVESPEVGGIRIALSQAAVALQKLEQIQTENPQ